MANEKACGAIIFTKVGNERKYVILRGIGVYRKYCGFPKGHVEAGETERETALREVKEETGLDVVLYDDFRTVDEHALAREGRPNDKKTNVYFLAEYHDQELVAQKSEVSEIILMSYEEALNSFEYEESKRELREAEEYLNKKQENELQKVYKSVLEADRAAVVICSLDHRIIYMNPSAISRYGKWGGGNLLGKSLLDCHNEESREKIHKVVAWFKASKENNLVYTSFNEKENKDVYMVALRDETGELIAYYEKHEYRNRETMKMYDME